MYNVKFYLIFNHFLTIQLSGMGFMLLCNPHHPSLEVFHLLKLQLCGLDNNPSFSPQPWQPQFYLFCLCEYGCYGYLR